MHPLETQVHRIYMDRANCIKMSRRFQKTGSTCSARVERWKTQVLTYAIFYPGC